MHPQEREQVALSYRRALLEREDWSAECRVVWPDRSVHWIRIEGSTRYEAESGNRMLGIVSDVTAHKFTEATRLLAQRLEGENRQIQEANRLKSQFVANMSHELRSPLNAIIGFSDLLSMDAKPIDPAKQRQFIGHIRTSGRHLLQLINDVLDLSKVESGKFEFFPERVDLPALVAEVNGVLYAQIHRRRLKVAVEIDPMAATVEVDPARLKQALYNYLSNAIKFTNEGGRVVVRVQSTAGERFRVEVEDTGIGIAECDIPRLFVEFQQLDASLTKRHQGTGLGLSLTRRLVEAQGGTVGVRSLPGVGSTFYLELPVKPALPELSSTEPERDPLATTQLLVIEEDLSGESRMAGALAASGYRVDVAAGMEQALKCATRHGYDALTVGLVQGSACGLDVLARIRQDSRNGNTPVVALTVDAHADGPAVFSVADVLAKPLRPDDVVLALARFGLTANSSAPVMVIDDDPAALELMGSTLEERGMRSVSYVDGRDALRDIAVDAPCAIILDLLMPDFSGFEVLDQLRHSPQWGSVPVFVWTSMTLTDSDYDLLALSAAAILQKGGGNMEQLLERLRRWLPPEPASRAQTL